MSATRTVDAIHLRSSLRALALQAASFAALLLACAGLAARSCAAAAALEYPTARLGASIEFPRDEGAHPQFRTEWWYVTGWLDTKGGGPLGFQITFFRTRPGVDEDNPSSFTARQLLFAHVAISDPQRGRLLRDEKAARAGFGLAGAMQGALSVHIDDWALRQDGARYTATLPTRDFLLDLEFTRTQPAMLQGDRGFSRKGPGAGRASHYYSLPQLTVGGTLVLDGLKREVRGVAWLDHEWMSSAIDDEVQGWDWVGLNLDDGGALISSQLRDKRGREYWALGAYRGPAQAQGESAQRVYSPQEIEWKALRRWRSPRTGVTYPVEWRVSIGERILTLRPTMDDQENDARGSTGTLYWEGAVLAFDQQGRRVGRGYLELTGYGSRLRF